MDTPIAITETELLAALAAALGDNGPSEAKTVAELSEMSGVPELRVRKALKAAAKDGRLGVHRVRRTAMDGRPVTVPGYTLAPAPKSKTR